MRDFTAPRHLVGGAYAFKIAAMAVWIADRSVPSWAWPRFIALPIISIVNRQALGVAYEHPQTDAGVAAIERARDIMRQLLYFLRSEDGPTAVEYAVMLALIVIACMAGVQALTQETAASYNRSSAAIDSAINP